MRLFQYEVTQHGASTIISEYYLNKKGEEVSRQIYYTNSVKSALLKVESLLRRAELAKAPTLEVLLKLIKTSEALLLKEIQKCQEVRK